MSEHGVEIDARPCSACGIDHDYMTWNSLGMLCGRCGQHTGNNHQGHYWGLCKVWLAEGKTWRESIRNLHFCCPGDCELEARNSVPSPRSSDA